MLRATDSNSDRITRRLMSLTVEYGDWLKDCFRKRKKNREISVEGMVLLEQYIAGVPDGLALVLKRRAKVTDRNS